MPLPIRMYVERVPVCVVQIHPDMPAHRPRSGLDSSIKLRGELFWLFAAVDLLLRAVLGGRSDVQGQSQPHD